MAMTINIKQTLKGPTQIILHTNSTLSKLLVTKRTKKSDCSLKIEPTLISCGKFGCSGVCNKKILFKSLNNPLYKVKYLIDIKVNIVYHFNKVTFFENIQQSQSCPIPKYIIQRHEKHAVSAISRVRYWKNYNADMALMLSFLCFIDLNIWTMHLRSPPCN